MKFKSVALGLAAMAAVTAPIGAAAVAADRASAPVQSANELEGNNGILIGVVAAVAIIAGIIIIADDDDEPISA